MQALDAAAAALESDDPVVAEASMQWAAELCAALDAQGVRLGTHERQRAAALHARCEAAAAKVRARLGGEIDLAARSRRAAHAYREG